MVGGKCGLNKYMRLQVTAEVLDEAVLRKRVRDNTVNRSTTDAQTVYSFYLLPGAHLTSLRVRPLLFQGQGFGWRC